MKKLEEILNLVQLRVRIEDISVKSRKHDLVLARWLFFLLATKFTKARYYQIGDMVNRDHSSVCYGLDNIHNEFKQYKEYKELYLELDAELSIKFSEEILVNVDFLIKLHKTRLKALKKLKKKHKQKAST